jgi:hypothetical protein
MKRLPALIALFSLALLLTAPAAEAPDATQQQVLVVAKEIRAQQAAIAENQAKFDAKLATIAEALRVARIFSSRGGGK